MGLFVGFCKVFLGLRRLSEASVRPPRSLNSKKSDSSKWDPSKGDSSMEECDWEEHRKVVMLVNVVPNASPTTSPVCPVPAGPSAASGDSPAAAGPPAAGLPAKAPAPQAQATKTEALGVLSRETRAAATVPLLLMQSDYFAAAPAHAHARARTHTQAQAQAAAAVAATAAAAADDDDAGPGGATELTVSTEVTVSPLMRDQVAAVALRMLHALYSQ